MAHSRNGGRRKLIVVFLLILSVMLVAADRHGTLAASGHWVAARLFQPAQSVSRGAVMDITNGTPGLTAPAVADPSGDAQALAALQAAKIADLEQQLREVRQITQALANYPLVLIPTRVISNYYVPPNTALGLDAGAKRGVGKGQLVLYRALGQGKTAGLKHGQQVVTGMGIVGVIDIVGDRASQMKLVTSSDCRLAARIVHWDGRTGRWVACGGGTTEGAGDGVLVKLLHVDRAVEVRTGDYVVTASNDTGLAENLIIGQVAQVSTRSADLTHTILVQPRAELAKLDEVYVLSIQGK
jgi:cell shape-determining protein MreC